MFLQKPLLGSVQAAGFLRPVISGESQILGQQFQDRHRANVTPRQLARLAMERAPR